VIKPVQGAGGSGIVIGQQASDADLAAVGERVLAEPRAWIAQEQVLLSTSPAQLGDLPLPGTSTCDRSRSTMASRSECCLAD
jgi:uncharacterized circularly permuted ATP-grasp superfamily protein